MASEGISSVLLFPTATIISSLDKQGRIFEILPIVENGGRVQKHDHFLLIPNPIARLPFLGQQGRKTKCKKEGKEWLHRKIRFKFNQKRVMRVLFTFAQNETMYTGLLHTHNLLRYVIVVLLILAVVKSFIGWFGKKEYTAGDNKISLFLLITAHLQLVIGLVLYFISPIVEAGLANMAESMKNVELRFWTVEHIIVYDHWYCHHHFRQDHGEKRQNRQLKAPKTRPFIFSWP